MSSTTGFKQVQCTCDILYVADNSVVCRNPTSKSLIKLLDSDNAEHLSRPLSAQGFWCKPLSSPTSGGEADNVPRIVESLDP